MGHYCRICGRERPNEQFSGKGHKIHVCKRCQARPKSERRAIEDKDDIFGFLEQSHISERNVARLERMANSDNPQVASLATIVLDVARVKPYKTRRLKFLAQKHPELLGKLRDTGLIPAHHWRASTTSREASAAPEVVRVPWAFHDQDDRRIHTHTSAEAEREAVLAVERAIYDDLFPVASNIENRNNSAALN